MTRVAAGVAAVLTLLAALTCCAGVLAPPAAAAPGPADAPEYWFDRWDVPSLWTSGADGHGVTIAEIDTGVTASLPELSGRVLSGTDLGEPGNGHVDRETSTFGHGTAMASIMVARPGTLGITGLAPGAKILPIAVPLRGTTDAVKPDRLPDAITYAADHGAKIINMSLGALRDPASDSTPCPDTEQAAVFHALRKGAIVVASVGNTGPTTNAVEEPAACLGVIAVGAVDATNTVASFSAREKFLTLTAPGVNVPSLGRVAGQAFAGDGTSQATALVSAALALAWSAHPQLTNDELTARLVATLDDPQATQSSAYGYGTLDAGQLVRADIPTGIRNPVWADVGAFSGRARALAGLSPYRPPAAAHGTPPTGPYRVAAHPRLTPRVVRGAGVAAAGFVVLLLAVAVRLRRGGGTRGSRR